VWPKDWGSHMHHIRKTFLMVAALVLLTTALMPAVAAAAPNRVTVPVTGETAAGDTFDGVYAISGFDVKNGELVAVGTLSGTLTYAATGVEQTVSNLRVTFPVTATGTCEILHLELGPLDLDLLGLVVHLDQVVLDITAESGPGNLLGNLLCAVAGLLDNGGPLTQIASLLNQILQALTR
jgi:hypothetical protein